MRMVMSQGSTKASNPIQPLSTSLLVSRTLLPPSPFPPHLWTPYPPTLSFFHIPSPLHTLLPYQNISRFAVSLCHNLPTSSHGFTRLILLTGNRFVPSIHLLDHSSLSYFHLSSTTLHPVRHQSNTPNDIRLFLLPYPFPPSRLLI